MTQIVRYAALATLVGVLNACGGGGGGDSSDSIEPSLQAALPDLEGIGFLSQEMQVAENERVLLVSLFRTGEVTGSASVNYSASGSSATADLDYAATAGVVEWGDAETGVKTFPLVVYSDTETEDTENLELTLTQASGSGLLDEVATTTVSILDAPCAAVISGQSAGSVHLSEPCYRLTGNMRLGVGDRLTGVPGATLVADQGVSVIVGEGASVSLIGAENLPIMLRGHLSQAGSWAGLELRDSDAVDNVLAYTVIRDAAIGVNVNNRSDLSAFRNNRVMGNNVALKLPATLLDKLDKSSKMNGNLGDYVVVGSASLDAEHTMPALDIAYLSDGNIVVNGKLTIAAGAQLHFAEGDFLIVSTTGVLVAVGTADAPIVFTGQQSIPGYWDGIHFSTMINNASRLEYVTVSYGGGDTGRPGNIALYGGAPNLAIRNSQISNSLGDGVWVSADQSNITTEGTIFSNNAGKDVFYN